MGARGPRAERARCSRVLAPERNFRIERLEMLLKGSAAILAFSWSANEAARSRVLSAAAFPDGVRVGL